MSQTQRRMDVIKLQSAHGGIPGTGVYLDGGKHPKIAVQFTAAIFAEMRRRALKGNKPMSVIIRELIARGLKGTR